MNNIVMFLGGVSSEKFKKTTQACRFDSTSEDEHVSPENIKLFLLGQHN